MLLFLVIIFIGSSVLLLIDIFVIAPIENISVWIVIAYIYGGIIFEIIYDAIIAFICELFVNKVNVNTKIFAVSQWEQRLYKFLGVKRIKGKLPDLGKLGNFAKGRIESPADPVYLELYMQHGIAGEINHWLSAILGFVIIFVYPLKWFFYFGFPIAMINAVLNILPIMALRYNRGRIMRIYKRQLKRQTEQKTNG